MNNNNMEQMEQIQQNGVQNIASFQSRTNAASPEVVVNYVSPHLAELAKHKNFAKPARQMQEILQSSLPEGTLPEENITPTRGPNRKFAVKSPELNH